MRQVSVYASKSVNLARHCCGGFTQPLDRAIRVSVLFVNPTEVVLPLSPLRYFEIHVEMLIGHVTLAGLEGAEAEAVVGHGHGPALSD